MEEYYSLHEIARVTREFRNYALANWKKALLVFISCIALSIAYYFYQKPKYEAITTFILEEKSSGGGLSGLASQIGLDIGGLIGGGSVFAGDNILDILQSKAILQKVLVSKVDPAKGPESETLADLFLEFRNWKKKWSPEEVQTISYSNLKHPDSLNQKQDSVINEIREYLVKKSLSVDRANKKGSIIKVQVNASNPVFARLLADRLVIEASKMFLSIRTGNALANIDRLQKRADSLLVLLNSKSYNAASTQLLDANPGMKVAGIPTEIAMRDKTVISTVYVEVMKNLEASKMLLSQQTPAIQILDKPSELLEDKRKSLLLLIIVGIAAGGFLGVGWLFVKFLFKQG